MGGKTKNKMLLICNDKQKKKAMSRNHRTELIMQLKNKVDRLISLAFCKQFVMNKPKQ